MNEASKTFAHGWRLEKWHVMNDESSRPNIYVRALVDVGSHEFSTCPLSYTERMQIVEAVGEEKILKAMLEIASEKRRPFTIEQQGRLDIALLKKLASKETAGTDQDPT